jgi:phenylacetate-CoA ligase
MRRSVTTALIADLAFPLHERLKGHDSTARRRELELTQWWSRAEIERLRTARLVAFLGDIGSRVPYYRELFAERRFDPSLVASIDDLAQLPFLTKDLIRSNGEALRAADAGALKRYNTGGSSGEPLIFYMGRDRVSHDVAAKWRATRWWNVDIGDPEIVVWGSPIELSAQDRLRGLRDRLLRTTLLPAFEMSEAKLDRFVDSILAARPRMLFGYPSALAHIARHAQAGGRRMNDLGIRVAFVTAERLYEHQKSVIEAVFGCPVANGYGARDAGFVAHECPHGGMHVSAEDIVVEIVDASGRSLPAGRSGEIVVTHLATRDFPFVRYRTGDIAVLDEAPCPCGRGLPLLKEIEGRVTDFVVARDGTVMHGLALIYAVRDVAGVQAFKIVQHDRDRTEVLLVVSPAFDPASDRRIVDDFRRRLGDGVSVEITKVDRIPAEPSGKHRYVVSRASSGGPTGAERPA